jgi:hypothetical protein
VRKLSHGKYTSMYETVENGGHIVPCTVDMAREEVVFARCVTA